MGLVIAWRLLIDNDQADAEGCDLCHAVRQLYWLTTADGTLHLCLPCSDDMISRLESGEEVGLWE